MSQHDGIEHTYTLLSNIIMRSDTAAVAPIQLHSPFQRFQIYSLAHSPYAYFYTIYIYAIRYGDSVVLFTATQPIGIGFESGQSHNGYFISNLRISIAVNITVDQKFGKNC